MKRICKRPECGTSFEPAVHNQRYCSHECKREMDRARKRADFTRAIVDVIDQQVDDDDVLELEEQNEYLRRENRRLENLVRKHKYKKNEDLQGLYRRIEDGIARLDIKPVSPPRNLSRGRDEEIANPVLSDFQMGKRTPTYNSEICAERINLFGDKVIKLTDIQRSDHPVNIAHVHALGDIVEGEDIFPGQFAELETSLYRQIIDGVEVTADFLRRMLSDFEYVKFVGVIGNHGRLSKKGGETYNPESNMDRLVYKFTSMLFADEPRIEFYIPDGPGARNFYAVDNIGEYSVMLVHGDQFPVPTSGHGYVKKVLGWKNSGIHEDFRDVLVGHYHQNSKMTIGNIILRIAGTPESDNHYASERLGVMGRPSQHLQFISPSKGIVTAEYDIWLDEDY